MKWLRTYLTFNAVVAALSGFGFIAFPLALTASQPEVIPAGGLIFVRTVGGMIITLGILDWYARDLKDSKMMQGVIVTNILFHAFSVGFDVLAISQGIIKDPTEWYNIAFRSALGLGFVYFLIRNLGKKSA